MAVPPQKSAESPPAVLEGDVTETSHTLPAQGRVPGLLETQQHREPGIRRLMARVGLVTLAGGGFRRIWPLASFLVAVAIPSLVVAVYFIFLASPQFTSEARLVVRTADPGTATDKLDSALAMLGSAFSYSESTQNSYVVTHYMRSATVLADLAPMVNLREIFHRPEADWWARLPKDAPQEELHAYWNKMVRAYVDAPSGIVTIEVRAFRPEDALEIVRALVVLSERLVNAISEQSRRDTMRLAEDDVRRTDAALRGTLKELQDLRNQEGKLDPLKSADETSKLLLQLLGEQVRLESEVFIATRTLTPDAPGVRQLQTRLEILKAQIQNLRGSLTGSESSKTVAAALTKFEGLEVQRQLNERLLSLAEQGLERARIKAERQGLYLMMFVSPRLATKAQYPSRWSNSLLFAIAAFLVWAIVTLTVAAVEDHRD